MEKIMETPILNTPLPVLDIELHPVSSMLAATSPKQRLFKVFIVGII